MTQKELMLKRKKESLKNPNKKIWNEKVRKEKKENKIKKSKSVFIHVPKTGGRYLNNILERSKVDFFNYGHKKSLHAKNTIKGFDDKFSFACVRNPYERFLSACVFNKLKDFEEASELVLKGELKVRYPTHFYTQEFFLADEEGVVIVDYIGRFENFNEFIEGLKERGVDVTKFHKFKENKSSDWETRLTEKTKENIRKIYKEDFELFNYEM
jgi:hypothetical protein